MGTEIQLYGIPLGEGTIPRTGNVAISVVWVRAEDSESWPYLVSAFESIALRDYAPAMVFAQSAVEIALMPMISKRLKRRAGAERVKAFMRDALTYGYALNVILPYLCGEIGATPMPDEVRGSLNKLRGFRNRIIHEGVKSSEISVEDVTEGIAAAAFGFEFTRYLEPLL
jgi:CRP-like cAMP-binding protein